MRPGNRLVAVIWGFAEATCFFIVPDVYLSYLALTNYKNALKACMYAVSGALAGGAVMYAYGAHHYADALHFIEKIPAISSALVQHAKKMLDHDLLIGMVQGSVTGIPYKIFAVHAGNIPAPFFLFLACSIVARLCRFLLVVSITSLISRFILKRLHGKMKIVIYLMFWIIFYVFYFMIMEW